MYYGLLSLSVVMFGVQFLMNNRYQKHAGSGMGATFQFAFYGNAVGLVCLLIINKFAFGFTPFTLIMAVLTALNSILYTFCSLKAFERINLSLYSIFAMLGGMALPFVFGILFYGEPLTLANVLCFVLITVALALTVKRGEKRGGGIYYAGVFVLNGMSGVLSKIFTSADFEKCNAAIYSIWVSLATVVISGAILLCMLKKLEKPSAPAFGFASGCGAISRVANYLLVLALAVLPATVQYPFVSGGTMIVSTAISFLCHQKPSKRELLSVALSFLGVLCLVLIPELVLGKIS